MDPVTIQQAEILWHTLGLKPSHRESNRNHYVAGPGHYAMPDLEALETSGLMRRTRRPAFLDPDDVVFAVTDSGRELALACLPPAAVPTRYDEFLDSGGDSFGEFLCGCKLPRLEIDWTRSVCTYRMYRRIWDEHIRGMVREVQGEWCSTKKAAKSSYKAALAAHQAKTKEAEKGIPA